MEYEENLKKGESQYDGYYDLEEDVIVDAKYRKDRNYPGNPFIEALPPPWNIKELRKQYSKELDIPTENELSEMDEYEKEDNVDNLLDKFRVQLPFHAIIEEQFHRALVRSYSRRRVLEDKNVDFELHLEGDEVITHNRTVPKKESEPVEGFTLLGDSGCGKSTGINMMLSHYPQTIIHERGTWQQKIQIVYLLVQCTANSNLAQLYENIGAAIDRALNLIKPVYQIQFQKGKLKDKYTLLKDLVSKFNIGCIILDEIELMDINSYKESSIQAFLTLTNHTGVAFAVVGTMDAYSNMIHKTRVTRRFGMSIIASRYCADRKRFGNIAKILTVYQWGDVFDEYTEEMIDVLFETSNGIISDLINIYKLIQKDKVRLLPDPFDTKKEIEEKKKKKLDVNPDYIRKKASDYYEILQRARSYDRDPYKDDDYKAIEKAILQMNEASELSEIAKSEARYDEVMKDDSYNKLTELYKNVKSGLKSLGKKYTEKQIERTINIITTNEGLEISTENAIAEVITYLDSKKEKKKEPDKALDIQAALKENDKDC